MDKIKNFFTTTIPDWWQKHSPKLVKKNPVASAVIGAVVLVSGTSIISGISTQTKSSKPSSEDSKTITHNDQTFDEPDNEENYYIAPDGTKWVSEEDYNEYVDYVSGKFYTTGQKSVEELPTLQMRANYYETPNGSKWESEECYNEYIECVSGNFLTTAQKNVKELLENTIYEAPDGSKWESEECYNEYISNKYKEAIQLVR